MAGDIADNLLGLHRYLRRRGNSASQVIKYIFCGGISVAVDQVTFYLLAWLVFPCLRLSDPVAKFLVWLGATVQEVNDTELQRNYWIIKVICFLVSNAAVYVLNVLYVFEAGRHRRPVEVLLFYLMSMVQFVFIWLGNVLIIRFGWEVTYSNVAMLILGIITNYLLKKNVVFKG